MANILPNGDVIPSHLSCRTIPSYDDGQAFSNIEMRLGEVQDIIYPEDPKSLSKTVIEYNVYVQHRARNTAVTRLYQNCILINPLSSLADKAFWTLRKSDSANKKGVNGLGLGSKVLILCVNGETNNAIIIGGIRDEKDTDDLNSKALGHHLEFIFNGMKAFINKDGELSINYGGKTNSDGETDVSDSSRNTSLTFLKDGSFQVKTDDGNGSVEQAIQINHTNKSIDINAKDHWNVNVSGNISINSDDICEIKTAGVKIGSATDNMLLATTYRRQENIMNTTMSSLYTSLTTAITASGVALSSASIAPTFSAAQAPLAAAGAAMSVAGPLMAQLSAAITTFESQAALYLSIVNKND